MVRQIPARDVRNTGEPLCLGEDSSGTGDGVEKDRLQSQEERELNKSRHTARIGKEAPKCLYTEANGFKPETA